MAMASSPEWCCIRTVIISRRKWRSPTYRRRSNFLKRSPHERSDMRVLQVPHVAALMMLRAPTKTAAKAAAVSHFKIEFDQRLPPALPPLTFAIELLPPAELP